MDTGPQSQAFEDPELAWLEHIEDWQAVGLIGLGVGALVLVLCGVGALGLALFYTLGRILG